MSLAAHVAVTYRPRDGPLLPLQTWDRVIITTGRYQGCTGFVDSAVFQRTVDQPDEYAPGFHVVLDNGEVVTVRWDQVRS